ncbi:unannotated protein [freshwater metagenome]|uniref:Unannotated protein n=1 Tax=freshwater metagenome TaxID=449393 RepID=A0A6J7RV18_9ZZZZ|nr:EamA family transporter [Actinomycetota bacterium]MTB24270.1 EamA family transporter [Actinomycetota bacterium]
MRSLSQARIATFALLGVTVVWGSTFILIKDSITRQPAADFLATRFTFAALLLILVRPKALKSISKQTLVRGSLLGIALGGGYLAQTFGLRTASAAVSGFITGLFVVFTPIIGGWILRRPVGRWPWVAALFATFGLALLSLKGWSMGGGEGLTVLCAVGFALHIVGLGEWSQHENAYSFAIVQLSIVALICWVAALTNGYQAPPDRGVWGALLFIAVAGTAIAFVIQTWAQALVAPTRAAVIMTMEPVFSGIFAVYVGNEHMTLKMLAGGALVLLAMYLVELGPKKAWQDVTRANH